MTNKIFFTLLVFILPNILIAQDNPTDTVTVKGLRHSDISIIQLIANPTKYNGFKISVTGYMHIKFEDCAIYLTKTDADYLNGSNALWVNFNENIKTSKINLKDEANENTLNYFDCKYVRITGVFNMNRRGHMGMFSGTIESVENIIEERQWYDGIKELWEDRLDGKGLVPKNKLAT